MNIFSWRRVDSRSLRSTLSYESTLLEFTDNLAKPPEFSLFRQPLKTSGLVFIKKSIKHLVDSKQLFKNTVKTKALESTRLVVDLEWTLRIVYECHLWIR
jgi:hypothetical protein